LVADDYFFLHKCNLLQQLVVKYGENT
jgi:hypothetical protein